MKNIAISALISSITLFASNSFAGPTLDTSFGSNGVVVLPGVVANSEMGVVILPDGKIFASVSSSAPPSTPPVTGYFVQLLPDGALDSSFPGGGIEPTSVFSLGATPTFLPNGQFLLADAAGVLNRFNANGTVDSSFQADPPTIAGSIGPMVIFHVLVLPNGQILAAGLIEFPTPPKTGSVEGAFARFNANGSLDTTFGQGGSVLIPSVTSVTGFVQIAVDVDGSILAIVGLGSPPVIHLTANGTPEAVSVIGPLQTEVVSSNGVIFQSNGDILVAGVDAISKAIHEPQLGRITVTGAADPTFSSPAFNWGTVNSVWNYPDTVAVEANGTIAMGGLAETSSQTDFGFAEFEANGSLETSFGTGGYTNTAISSLDEIEAIAVQPADGKIVAVGFGRASGQIDGQLEVVRYVAP